MTGMQLPMGFAKQKKNPGACPLLSQNKFLQKKRGKITKTANI
jgi:hypothetical protein